MTPLLCGGGGDARRDELSLIAMTTFRVSNDLPVYEALVIRHYSYRRLD